MISLLYALNPPWYETFASEGLKITDIPSKSGNPFIRKMEHVYSKKIIEGMPIENASFSWTLFESCEWNTFSTLKEKELSIIGFKSTKEAPNAFYCFLYVYDSKKTFLMSIYPPEKFGEFRGREFMQFYERIVNYLQTPLFITRSNAILNIKKINNEPVRRMLKELGNFKTTITTEIEFHGWMSDLVLEELDYNNCGMFIKDIRTSKQETRYNPVSNEKMAADLQPLLTKNYGTFYCEINELLLEYIQLFVTLREEKAIILTDDKEKQMLLGAQTLTKPLSFIDHPDFPNLFNEYSLLILDTDKIFESLPYRHIFWLTSTPIKNPLLSKIFSIKIQFKDLFNTPFLPKVDVSILEYSNPQQFKKFIDIKSGPNNGLCQSGTLSIEELHTFAPRIKAINEYLQPFGLTCDTYDWKAIDEQKEFPKGNVVLLECSFNVDEIDWKKELYQKRLDSPLHIAIIWDKCAPFNEQFDKWCHYLTFLGRMWRPRYLMREKFFFSDN